MKMTLITNSKRELVGSVQGSCTTHRVAVADKDGQALLSVGLIPGPDQKLIEVEVPDELAKCEATDLHEHLEQHLAKRK
jgi:hypothetical protein